VASVIRALSGLTPGGNRNVQAALLDIDLGNLEEEDSEGEITEGVTLEANPRRRPPSEFTIARNDQLQSGETEMFGGNLTSVGGPHLTSAEVALSIGLDGRNRRISEEHPALFREEHISDGLASVSHGGRDYSSPYHSAPNHGFLVSTLTPTHSVSDVGRYPRAGGSMTPGEMEISQRRGRASLENVTQRDSKRPSKRPRDREYHRRFSVGVPVSRVVFGIKNLVNRSIYKRQFRNLKLSRSKLGLAMIGQSLLGK
jgi:hypothetical protein